jgi:leukotriene-A4 hydrolase
MIRDLSSLSNPHEIKVTHLDWRVAVDFDHKVVRGLATYTLAVPPQQQQPSLRRPSAVDLDTAHLIIEGVTSTATGSPLQYKLHKSNPKKPHLGKKLSVYLPTPTKKSKPNNDVDDDDDAALSITISYRTTQQCTAIQWLAPSATSGKLYPFLFTQCQAIHARSLVPCQDVPGVKFTYTARATVPKWSTCVMSAVLKSSSHDDNDDGMNGDEQYIDRDNYDGDTNATENRKTTTYCWEQTVPIPSYLLAMAVGQLDKRDVSDRCSIWSEPALLEAAAYEFAQAEDFLRVAEGIAGAPYAWGRYDLLCLPPSCPYGGMENPCLTFVTPTLLAGDRSLADVIAHEQAHSWTGNLVTNASWDHFWLNEGWTTWFQRKIMARIHLNSDAFFDFDALGGYKSLQDTVGGEMPPEFTKLVLQIGDRDPDDAYSTVAYEKGFHFLYSLEKRVGKESFERFFQAYVMEFSYQTVSSEEFRTFFLSYFRGNDSVQDVPWDAWLYGTGMPPETVEFDKTLATASENLARAWLAFDRNDPSSPPSTEIKSWSSLQICSFLDFLQLLLQQEGGGGTPLKVSTLAVLNAQYGLASTKNAEILHRYCELAIASEDASILPTVLTFITTQGRMKFVRPLYRSLHKSAMAKELAVETFLDHADFYHPICAKMIAQDLMVAELGTHQRKQGGLSLVQVLVWSVAASGLVAVGVVLFRRSKR